MDDEVREEIESHLAMRTELNRDAGMSDSQARKAAIKGFGNPTSIRETIYEMNGFGFVDTVLQDLRHGLRQLYKNKSWTVVAILSLAIGIGANAGLFGFLSSFVEKLPVHNPDELVGFHYGKKPLLTSVTVFEQLRASNQTLTEIFAFSTNGSNCHPLFPEVECRGGGNLVVNKQGEMAGFQYVSGNYFNALGVSAIRGRTFGEADDSFSAEPVAVISYPYWQRRFHEGPSIIGSSAFLDDQPVTIIGVLPEGMRDPLQFPAFMADILLPLALERRTEEQQRRALLRAGMASFWQKMPKQIGWR